jgi:hypothetical protein
MEGVVTGARMQGSTLGQIQVQKSQPLPALGVVFEASDAGIQIVP